MQRSAQASSASGTLMEQSVAPQSHGDVSSPLIAQYNLLSWPLSGERAVVCGSHIARPPVRVCRHRMSLYTIPVFASALVSGRPVTVWLPSLVYGTHPKPQRLVIDAAVSPIAADTISTSVGDRDVVRRDIIKASRRSLCVPTTHPLQVAFRRAASNCVAVASLTWRTRFRDHRDPPHGDAVKCSR